MIKDRSLQPIAIFDSGVGGLTVARAIKTLLPYESILYLADTVERPFGTKSPEDLEKIVERNLRILLSYPIKMIVIACHTACTCNFKIFQDLPVPVMTIFPTALDLLMGRPELSPLLVLGTNGTIRSQIYQRWLLTHFPLIRGHFIGGSILEQLIEEECQDPHHIMKTLHTLFAPVQQESLQAVFLGCTHFPIYKNFIQQALGNSVQIIDPAFYFSNKIYEALTLHQLFNESDTPPTDHYLVTGNIDCFKTKLLCYFGETLGKTAADFNQPYAML